MSDPCWKAKPEPHVLSKPSIRLGFLGAQTPSFACRPRGQRNISFFLPQLSLSADLGSGPKTPVRPSWATHQSPGYPVTKATAKMLAQSTRWNAGIRPAPVRPPVPKLSEKGKKAFTRMDRSLPGLWAILSHSAAATQSRTLWVGGWGTCHYIPPGQSRQWAF